MYLYINFSLTCRKAAVHIGENSNIRYKVENNSGKLAYICRVLTIDRTGITVFDLIEG